MKEQGPADAGGALRVMQGCSGRPYLRSTILRVSLKPTPERL
jgi:hypothetical protein